MLPVALLLHELGLALRLYVVASAEPSSAAAIDATTARAHVTAAVEAATDEVGPELLLAIAFVESRYDPRWISRVERGRRVTSRYPRSTPPAKLDPRGSLYCGALQTRARDWDDCMRQRDLHAAYRAGAAELTTWLRDRRVRGDLSRALAGYGCGNHGVRTGKCNRYPARVLWQARRLAGGSSTHRRSRS